ncbi:MAG: outer membrane protein [Labilithrix sp.]|nr:outer membrane protein [Labilithrix sp.]
MKNASFLLPALLTCLAGLSWSPRASAQNAAPPPSREDAEWAERDAKMNEAATLTGGVGLVHVQHAQGGAVGQFRVGFTTEYFSAGFLCTSAQPCRDPRSTTGGTLTSDSSDHIGGRLTLSMQVTKWLEPYLATSAFANSNNANRPSLLQVLGDSTLGAKVHGSLGNVIGVGGAMELWLVNGTGSVGLDGGGTGAKFRGLATADLRGLSKPLPLRFSTNLTYVLDNTGQVVEATEAARGTPITRIERFGLGINRTDHFDIGLGGEVFLAQDRVRPFVEYNIAIPVNRQNYLCRPDNPSRDLCLANEKIAPSSITFGGRFFPWKRGFNLLAALDVGVSGTSTFIEEVKPEAPWMLYLGAGWAFDTQDRPPVVTERIVEKVSARAPGRKIRGFVHEEGTQTAVPGAIISWDNHSELTSLVTGTDGRFTTQELDEGPYIFGVRAEGYRPGQCTTSIVRPTAAAPAARPGSAPARAPAPPSGGGGDVQLDCPVVALPRVGQIVGHVKDADTGAPVPNAALKLTDAARKELTGTADQSGSFRFADVSPGEVMINADAEGYLASTDRTDVKPRVDNTADVLLHKRPKNANVTVGKSEIVIKQQIQFALDSSTILPESNGLLTEIADALIKNPRIKQVEVQGHTDNTGTPDHNQTLSDERAKAVVSWLTAHGVASDRLNPHGYGQSKPLVPNVTGGNRAKNRRVQFIITAQDPAAPKK